MVLKIDIKQNVPPKNSVNVSCIEGSACPSV